MTYEQYSPEWLIEHCDNEIAFERAVSRQMSRLLAENDDFRATIDHLTRENAEQIGEIVALKEQRDELLEALRSTADLLQTWIDGAPPYDEAQNDRELLANARAAIAKAGGAA